MTNFQIRLSILAALRQAEKHLIKTSDAPQLDVERLLLHALGRKESAWLYTHGEENLTAQQKLEFEKLVAERATGKPLAYILGEWEFYGRPFFVNEDVLIPRPETGKLVDEALRYIDISKRSPFVIADIGTGSGVIAITLALELRTPSHSPLSGGESRKRPLPDKGGWGWVSIIATDISPAALEVAKRNAKRHGVEHLIDFRLGDMFKPLEAEKIDLIVSNPPYLPAEALAEAGCTIETAGLKFEPRLALDGGSDGLRLIREFEDVSVPVIYESLGGKIHIRE